VKDGHVKDAAQDVAKDMAKGVAEDVSGAAEDGSVKVYIFSIVIFHPYSQHTHAAPTLALW